MHDRAAGWLGGLGTGVALTLLFGKEGPANRTVVRDRLIRYGRIIREKARNHADEHGSANSWLVGVAGLGVGLLAYGLIRMADRGELYAEVTRSLEEFVEGELSPEEDSAPGGHANQYVNEDANFEFSGDSAGTQQAEIPTGLTMNRNRGAGTSEGEASGAV